MEYKVATEEKPTFFNKDAALGTLLGFIALMTITPVAIPAIGLTAAAANFAIPLAGAAAGGILGAIDGRSRMKRDLEEGKTVREPSMFNKKTAIGGLAGFLTGEFAGFAVAGILAATALAVPVIPAMLAGGVLGALAGGIIGGKSGKSEMAREFDAATQAQAQQDRLLAVAREKQIEQFANAPVIGREAEPRMVTLNIPPQDLGQNGAPAFHDQRALEASQDNPSTSAFTSAALGAAAAAPIVYVIDRQNAKAHADDKQPAPVTIVSDRQPAPQTLYVNDRPDAPVLTQTSYNDDRQPAPASMTFVADRQTAPAPASFADDRQVAPVTIIADRQPAVTQANFADDKQPAATPVVFAADRSPAAPAATFTENNPSNNTTIITATDNQQPAPAESHTHNITNNTYTTVITATPQQSDRQADAAGATINNTLLATADSQPATTVIAKPEATSNTLVASTEPQQQAQGVATEPKKPTVIEITISGAPGQQVAMSDATGVPQADGKFTSAVLAERQQQPVIITVQGDKGPGKGYVSNITAERQAQPTTQTTTV